MPFFLYSKTECSQAFNKLNGEVNWNIFLGPTLLKTINLWGNRFTGTVDWSVFTSLDDLIDLDLRANQFNGTIDLSSFKNMIGIGSIFLTSNNWDEINTKLDFTEFVNNPRIRIDPQYICDDTIYCDVSNGFHSITRTTANNNHECFPKSALGSPTRCSCTCQCTNGNGTSFISPLCFGNTFSPTGKPSQSPTNYPSSTPTMIPTITPSMTPTITPSATPTHGTNTPTTNTLAPSLIPSKSPSLSTMAPQMNIDVAVAGDKESNNARTLKILLWSIGIVGFVLCISCAIFWSLCGYRLARKQGIADEQTANQMYVCIFTTNLPMHMNVDNVADIQIQLKNQLMMVS